MRWKALFILFAGYNLGTSIATAQKNYPPELPGSTAMVYKTVGNTDLRLWLYKPDGHNAEADQRPAVVFFFGGGWKAGTPQQFEAHCQYLAGRGIVAATADYRVSTRHNCKADACVEDAKSAIRWVRKNASKLGVDPNRICAAGGSAGGHTACCAGVVTGFEAEGEDHSISSKPNALALFNPAVLIAPLHGFDVPGISEEKYADIASRTGVPPEQISPIHHVTANLPPTIIFHGKADDTVPFATVAEFGRRATAEGNRCEVHGFADAPHGFFNGGRGKTDSEKEQARLWQRRTLRKLDEFLHSLQWLDENRSDKVVDEDFVALRGNYKNSFARFAKEKKGHVAFLGGSITEMDGYRPRIAEWLQKRFPETEFQFTNAGISSTCSNTGAFRLQRDVLSKGTVDLLFVEFAVNDDQDAAHSADRCVQGMEGIIRHTRQHNPCADVVMTHFVNPGMLETLASDESILSASQHEIVARHYGISSVYLSKVVAARIGDGTLTWKEFGGTHPGPVGNQLAADLVTSVLTEAWRGLDINGFEAVPHELPLVSIRETSFSQGRLLLPDQTELSEGWEVSIPDWDTIKGGKRSRFLNVPMLHSTTPNAATEFTFHGNAVGAYMVAGPDAGRLEFQVDDQGWGSAELYHRFSKTLHYPRTVMFGSGLKPGKHRLRLRVSSDRHEQSQGNAARVIGFAVNGSESSSR